MLFGELSTELIRVQPNLIRNLFFSSILEYRDVSCFYRQYAPASLCLVIAVWVFSLSIPHYSALFNISTSEAGFLFAAVSLAISRDGGSGGVIRLGAINKDGIERHVITGDDIPKFYEN